MKKRKKPTLAQLIAETSQELNRSPGMIEWDRMPAVGREWPNPGWDGDPTLPVEPTSEIRQAAKQAEAKSPALKTDSWPPSVRCDCFLFALRDNGPGEI